MATIALDYDLYPHIIEAIVSHAPFGALLPLRATCNAINLQVDALLFTHQRLYEIPGPEYNHSGHRATPSYILTLPKNSSVRSDTATPRLPDFGAPQRAITLDADCRRVTHDLAEMFTKLHTLRRTLPCVQEYHDSFFPHVHTAVYLLTLQEDRRVNLGVDRPLIHIPRSVERLVLHIRHEKTKMSGTLDNDLRLTTGNTIREFVFAPWPPYGHLYEFMTMVFRFAARGSRDGFDITVVGLERAYPELLPDPNNPAKFDADHVKRAMRDTYQEFKIMAVGPEYAPVVELPPNLRVLTLEEWYAELGNRREMERGFEVVVGA
ncbi:hypothetical protein Q8F55_000047 [Vanrija albida]|uniref:F-box domain-containing protein n=1 Tax=Vanrija albida TaxID=181172 RepID=A0ABR3QC70_9TREE